MLNINKNLEGEKLTIALEGRLDTVTAPELEAELKDSLEPVNLFRRPQSAAYSPEEHESEGLHETDQRKRDSYGDL